MRRVMRWGCYETNSSSSHCVTVQGKENIDDCGVDRYVGDDGYIHIELGEYGWSGDPCDTFISKLEYAMSMVLHTEYTDFNYYDDDFTVDQDRLEDLDGYQIILSAIRDHIYCEGIIIEKRKGAFYPYGYIDHQSHEYYKSLAEFLDDWNVSTDRFLFDDGVVIHILNDNG